MAYETVLYDVADRVCTVTLNRPDRLNAWTRQMHLDLIVRLEEVGIHRDHLKGQVRLAESGWQRQTASHLTKQACDARASVPQSRCASAPRPSRGW